jgi:hypothetical protein
LQGKAQWAPLKTHLKPQTQTEFQAYAQQVESELNNRWSGKNSFLRLDEDSGTRQRVLNGEVWIQAGVLPNPRSISDGLIHDWYGAVYIPSTSLAQVLSVLQDFDHHSSIYPPVVKSRLIKRNGEDITGYWRLEQKGQMLPAVFDVTQTVHYKKIAPDKWTAESHANDIRAVEDSGSKKEKVLPPGEGIGLMWKLYSYWSLEQVGNGVMAECRTVSLSRGVPGSLAWMVRPFINAVPRDSMDSTLRSTRKASETAPNQIASTRRWQN